MFVGTIFLEKLLCPNKNKPWTASLLTNQNKKKEFLRSFWNLFTIFITSHKWVCPLQRWDTKKYFRHPTPSARGMGLRIWDWRFRMTFLLLIFSPPLPPSPSHPFFAPQLPALHFTDDVHGAFFFAFSCSAHVVYRHSRRYLTMIC